MERIEPLWKSFGRATAIWANLVALFLLIGLGSYVYTHDDPYLYYPDLPLPTLQSAVRVGYTIPLKLNRCNRDSVVHVYVFTARLINDDDAHAPPINLRGNAAIRLEPGCHEETSEVNRIPTSTPPGRYHLEGYADIRMRFHSYLVEWRSASFQVVPDLGNTYKEPR